MKPFLSAITFFLVSLIGVYLIVFFAYPPQLSSETPAELKERDQMMQDERYNRSLPYTQPIFERLTQKYGDR